MKGFLQLYAQEGVLSALDVEDVDAMSSHGGRNVGASFVNSHGGGTQDQQHNTLSGSVHGASTDILKSNNF
jgi:hypothetical protein